MHINKYENIHRRRQWLRLSKPVPNTHYQYPLIIPHHTFPLIVYNHMYFAELTTVHHLQAILISIFTLKFELRHCSVITQII